MGGFVLAETDRQPAHGSDTEMPFAGGTLFDVTVSAICTAEADTARPTSDVLQRSPGISPIPEELGPRLGVTGR